MSTEPAEMTLGRRPIVSPDPAGGAFHILALSGGGYRGLYTARILADLEGHVGEPLARRFDLLAGTSIGGILALALALEIPAEKMVRLFEEHGEEIFRRRFSLFGILRASYTQDRLRSLLEDDGLFGQRCLMSVRHRVLVPSINYSSGQPVVFKTAHHADFYRDQQYRLVDIALATSAAPGYFPRHVFDHNQYVDGGLFANAPGMLALHEAQCFLDQSPDALRLLAIGTMSSKFTVDPSSNRAGGTLDWGGWNPTVMPKRLFGLAISAQESLTHFQLTHRLAVGHYFHIDQDLTDERARAVALDKADSAAREVLLGAAGESAKAWLGKSEFRAMLQHRALAPKFSSELPPRKDRSC
ncbi:MAG: CBASS cGAMP-activated phospholipase [Lysobacterales bacterium]